MTESAKEPKKTVVFNEVPRCSTPEQYAAWLSSQHRKKGRIEDRNCGFCSDCTPKYADSMRKKGLCDYPEIVFKKSKDGGIVGKF